MNCSLCWRTICLTFAMAVLATPEGFALQNTKNSRTSKTQVRESARLREVVAAAFAKTHDGWSSDEVILNTELNQAFVEACQQSLPDANPVDFNWTLLNMRKAGLLKTKSSKRSNGSVASFAQLAEIAARLVHDRYHVSTDRMMADPLMRDRFDEEVKKISPEADLYSVRKAAFRLRKQRQLKPELITRIADWGREIHTFSVDDVLSESIRIPDHPGIYIFRDPSGYLYIGQSDNLRNRLSEHLDDSSNFSLARYLADRSNDKITIEVHAFAPTSRAKETMVRRAYESELIASRKPRFNIQP